MSYGVVEGMMIWVGIPQSFTGEILIFTLGVVLAMNLLEIITNGFAWFIKRIGF